MTVLIASIILYEILLKSTFLWNMSDLLNLNIKNLNGLHIYLLHIMKYILYKDKMYVKLKSMSFDNEQYTSTLTDFKS